MRFAGSWFWSKQPSEFDCRLTTRNPVTEKLQTLRVIEIQDGFFFTYCISVLEFDYLAIVDQIHYRHISSKHGRIKSEAHPRGPLPLHHEINVSRSISTIIWWVNSVELPVEKHLIVLLKRSSCRKWRKIVLCAILINNHLTDWTSLLQSDVKENQVLSVKANVQVIIICEGPSVESTFFQILVRLIDYWNWN